MKKNLRTLKVFMISAFILVGILAGFAYAVLNGQPDIESDYPYVGLVTNALTTPGGVNVCSCVAISETILVTSAHCFQQGETVSVTFDPEVDPRNPFAVTWFEGAFYPDDDFCIGCAPGLPGFDTHDVAVIELDRSADLSDYAELPSEGLNDSLGMRTEVTTVGYGVTHFIRGGGPPAWGFPDGVVFTRYFAPVELVTSKHKHQSEYIKLSGNPAQGKGGSCFGDSGGPNLLGGTDIILGLTAYGANHMCAGVGYANRIDTDYALEFINSFLPSP